MNILVTNDDGIRSYGIQVLAQELSKIGTVYVSAPSLNQSGSGHGLTVVTPLRAHKFDFPGIQGKAWSVDGTPADCVKLSIEKLMPVQPDVVVSGINNGSNLGTDVIYSGTVAAAMEGFFHGLPSVAISAARDKSVHGEESGNYLYGARLAAEYCQKLVNDEIPRTLLNINIPGCQPEDVRGVKMCAMGWRWYTTAYDKRVDPAGGTYYWLQGEPVDELNGGNTDVEAIAAGYASVTPLDYNMTNYDILNRFKS